MSLGDLIKASLTGSIFGHEEKPDDLAFLGLTFCAKRGFKQLTMAVLQSPVANMFQGL